MVSQVQTRLTGHEGLPGVSTINFIGDSDAASADGLAEAVHNFWESCASAIHSAVLFETTGVVTVIDDQTGQTTAQHPTTEWGGQGTSIQDRLPLGTQGLVLLRTGVYVGGREIRGRIYVPAPTRDFSTAGGRPESAYLQQIVDAAELHLMTVVDFPLGVYSRTYLQNPPVSSVSGSSHWARLSTRQR